MGLSDLELDLGEQKASAASKAQIEKLQQERDEFQRMVIGNQQIRTKQIHEMKKKEKEYVKLQERLNQVLMEKKKESKSGIEIMNLLQKEGRQRGTWNGKKADGEFYKMIVDAYETKKQELMAENADLRALLRSMQDRVTLQEKTKQLEAEHSALRKMSMDLDKESSEDEQESWATAVKSWSSDVERSTRNSRKV